MNIEVVFAIAGIISLAYAIAGKNLKVGIKEFNASIEDALETWQRVLFSILGVIFILIALWPTIKSVLEDEQPVVEDGQVKVSVEEVGTETEDSEDIIINFTSGVYDDFNTPTNSGLDEENWVIRSGELGITGEVSQQDGALILSNDVDSSGNGISLGLRKWLNPQFRTFEAKVKLSKLTKSGIRPSNNLSINAVSSVLSDGWTEIGLGFIKVGHENFLADLNTDYDTWYIVRLEFDNKERTIDYYLNDIKVATYIIPGTNQISLTPEIQLWHNDGEPVKAFIDYVKIE